MTPEEIEDEVKQWPPEIHEAVSRMARELMESIDQTIIDIYMRQPEFTAEYNEWLDTLEKGERDGCDNRD